MFTHLKLCLADAIHNFKWVKIIQIDKMEVNDFEILLNKIVLIDITLYNVNLYHVYDVEKVILNEYNWDRRLKG